MHLNGENKTFFYLDIDAKKKFVIFESGNINFTFLCTKTVRKTVSSRAALKDYFAIMIFMA
jgi:hypothetical protein